MQEKKTDMTKKLMVFGVMMMVFQIIMSIPRAELSMMHSPLLTNIAADLGVDIGFAGTLGTTATLCMGIGCILASLLIDRFGTRKCLVLGFVGYFVAGLLAYMSTGASMMILSRVATGLSNGLTYSVMAVMVSERFFTQGSRGFGNSLIQASNSLATTITFATTIPLFAMLGNNWRKQYMLWGVVLLAMGVLWFLIDSKPDSILQKYNAERNAPAATAEHAAPAETGNSLMKAIRMRKVWSATISFTGATWLFMAFQTYLPTILKTVHGMEAQQASNMTGLISTAGLVTCIFTALFMGKVKNFKSLYLICMIVLPLSGIGAMLVKPGLLMQVFIVLIGASWAAFVPVCNVSLMIDQGITPKIYAAANGMFNILGNTLCMAMPFVFGMLQARMGMQNAALCLCLAGIVSVAGALMYPSDKKAA